MAEHRKQIDVRAALSDKTKSLEMSVFDSCLLVHACKLNVITADLATA